MNYYILVLKKYAVFDGRAHRKEFWFFVLFNSIIVIALGLIGEIFGIERVNDVDVLSGIYLLAVLIPSIAVSIRRLHDTNRSGGCLFISLVPLVGVFILIALMIQDSQPGVNQYGSNPKTIATE